MQFAISSEDPPLRQDPQGVIRVGGTRVTLQSVVGLFEQGASAEEIALRFDALDLHAVYATLSYYLGHREELQGYLDRQQAASAGARREAERRFSPAAVRARIAQRRMIRDVEPVG